MDDKLRELMQELGNAISGSLGDSEGIAEAIDQIKQAGYDIFLVLEATIGFRKRGDIDENFENQEHEEPPAIVKTENLGWPRKIGWTAQDLELFRDVGIKND